MSDLTRVDLLRLARSEGIGPVNFQRMLAQYRTPGAALAALPDRAIRAGRPTPPKIPSRDAAEAELAGTEVLGGRILFRGDADYPPLLATLPDAPAALSVLGNPARLARRAAGIVGARNASAAGLRIAESLSAELAASGILIVSGLARGIDAAAHRAALHPGLTVAAIAGGLDKIYPPEHADLQAQIAERGCVVTEAALGTVPQSRHFPRRNRLIAGLSLGCVIVEAAQKSGTLITADLALRYGREVFAAPGSPLDPRARGGNALIREGAHLVETAADVLRDLPPYPDFSAPFSMGFAEPVSPWGQGGQDAWCDLDQTLNVVVGLLSPVPVTVDEVVQRCQFSVSAVLTVLTELELAGRVEFLPGGLVALLPT